MLDTTRREFVLSLLGGAAGWTLSVRARAQGGGAVQPAPITATKLTDSLTVLSGVGGNVGLVNGRDGLLMIDGGTASRAEDLANMVHEISPSMVQVLFNTHYHFDHVGSNELLGKRKARIIAHANVKARLSTAFEDAAMGRSNQPLAAEGLPAETFTSGGRLSFGSERLEYTHIPLAHTDGDAFVFFSGTNVLHTGDLLWMGRYPVVDYSVGGSLAGMAASLGQMDKAIDGNTRIIPGHGPTPATRADMRQTRDMWLAINQRLELHAKQGHSADEVVMAAPTADFDAKVGVQNPAAFVRQAYGGVLAKR